MQVNPDLSRALPEFPDVLTKLTDGTYTLHGGVIRTQPALAEEDRS